MRSGNAHAVIERIVSEYAMALFIKLKLISIVIISSISPANNGVRNINNDGEAAPKTNNAELCCPPYRDLSWRGMRKWRYASAWGSFGESFNSSII